MAIKINIGKILSAAVWSCLVAGVGILLVAAIRYRNNNTCRGYLINISSPPANSTFATPGPLAPFVTKKDIALLLAPAGAFKVQDRPTQSFDLHRLEMTLEKNIWIQKARLFFDNNSILHVDVTERTPATRIFTSDGNSFYLDNDGIQLPVITQLPARLPVFTGYPPVRAGRRLSDSLLKADILRVSAFIRQDSFWMAQIAQVNITPERTFELEPETGDQRIGFGDGSDVGAKFHRLLLFYQQILSKTGFEKYTRIDVSYAGQVVATKKGSGGSHYDSLQGMNNIRQLIRAAQQLQPDTIRQQSVRPLEHSTLTEQNLTTYDLLPAKVDSSIVTRPLSSSAHNPKTIKPKH